MAKYCGTGLNTFMYIFYLTLTLRKPTQNEKPLSDCLHLENSLANGSSSG